MKFKWKLFVFPLLLIGLLICASPFSIAETEASTDPKSGSKYVLMNCNI